MKQRTRGAALLTAMLTVTLVATFAAAALWQQWRSVDVEAAERGRVQAAWVLTGASDWARLILREDARTSGTVDHLAEPWAVPLQEARLSTFLAADATGASDAGSDTENVFLSGQITDQQGLLNVSNLVQGGTLSTKDYQKFQRLFELLGLPQSDLNRLGENVRFANDISTDNRSASQAPLMPVRAEQLGWLGVSASTVQALLPFVTVLPGRTQGINLNTAPAEVIYAAVDGLSLAEAQDLVARRAQAPFRTLSDATRILPQHAGALTDGSVAVSSSYFEVRGRLRMDKTVLEERSLVQRSGGNVRTLQRERAVVDPATLAQAQATTGR